MIGEKQPPVRYVNVRVLFAEPPSVDAFDALGIQPTRTMVAGEPINPKRPEGPVHRDSNWQFESTLFKADFDAHLEELEPLLQALATAALPVEIEMQVVLIGADVGNGSVLSPAFVQMLAACNASVSLDVFDEDGDYALMYTPKPTAAVMAKVRRRTQAEQNSRAFAARYRWPLAQQTFDAIDRWAAAVAIEESVQVRGDAAVAVRNYCAQTAALALLHGTVEPLRKGLHAALLLAAVIPADADPRAVDEGPDTSGLRYIALVAERLGYNLDEELAFLGEPDFARALTHTAIDQLSTWLDRDLLLVERWGTPWLASVWDPQRWRVPMVVMTGDQPLPWSTEFPWPQTGAVLAAEPDAAGLVGADRARRQATEFARTGDIATGLAALEDAATARLLNHEAMAVWSADHLGGPDAVEAFGICAADIGIEIDNPEPLAVVDDRWGDIVVTDPLSGPTFDRLLPDARSSRP